MSLTKEQQATVMQAARALIGTKYKELDCSHFIHRAYASAGLAYPYLSTASFNATVGTYFAELDTAKGEFEPADVLMFSGHMGLWDAEGCTVLQNAGTPNTECTRLNNNLPVLSSRSGGNRGPDFGGLGTKWFGKVKAVYRWKGGQS